LTCNEVNELDYSGSLVSNDLVYGDSNYRRLIANGSGKTLTCVARFDY